MTTVRRAAHLRPNRLATALADARCAEVAGANRTSVRRLLSGLRRAWLLVADPTVVHDLDGQRVLLPLSHELPAHRSAHRGYSENLGDVVAAVASVRPDASVVDIGANVGDSVAIVRSRVAVPILCVEGDDVFLPYLRRNVAAIRGVEVAPTYVATSATVGSRAVIERTGGTARIVEGAEGQSVVVRPLADVLADHPLFLRPTVLKVDTDGNDATILRAAWPVIAASHPVLFFEHDPAMAVAVGAPDPRGFFAELATLGYRWFVAYANTGERLGTFEGGHLDALEDLATAVAPSGPVAYLDVCAVHAADRELFEAIVDDQPSVRR